MLVRAKYGGELGERFGPTLAAEHLASDDGLRVDAETLRRWMLKERRDQVSARPGRLAVIYCQSA